MSRYIQGFFALTMMFAAQFSHAQSAGAVTAIDILLDPDAVMIAHANDANAALRQSYPQGFSLGGTHAPHVTLLQRYVRSADLEKVYASVAKVLKTAPVMSWKLKAIKHYYVALPPQPVGVGGIVIEPTADLLKLQQQLIDAVAPFTVSAGSTAAFVTTAEDPNIIPEIIDYVAEFVPKYAGPHYNPHVTTGIGTLTFLEAQVAAPFDTFTFSPVGVSVYQLGNYGTAMKKLHDFHLKTNE